MSEEGGFSVTIPEFVIQEAREKQFEIEIKALKQFEKEKKAYLEVEEAKVNDYFEDLAKKCEQEFRIRRSAAINTARLSKMEARNRAMMKVFSQTQYDIYKKITSDKAFYKGIMQKLMLQGLVQLYEKNVKVRCLKDDEALVKEIIPKVQADFQKMIKEQLELDFKVNIEIDTDSYLEKRKLQDNSQVPVSKYTMEQGQEEVIGAQEDDRKCFGGVILTNVEGNIISKGTLDKRIDMCFQESLPELRAILFPRK